MDITYKVHPNSRDITLSVRIIGEPQQQTGLADAGVSDQQQLKEVIVSGSVLLCQQRVRAHGLPRLRGGLHGWRMAGGQAGVAVVVMDGSGSGIGCGCG